MISVNKATIIGRLGKDPESRSFNNGSQVVNVTVATSETWKDKQSGERKEKTEWHTVAIFNEAKGKFIKEYAKKGDLVMVEGAITTRKWQDKDGADRYSTEIQVKPFFGDIQLHNPKGEGGNSSSGGSDDGGFGSSGGAKSGNSGGGSSRNQSISDAIDDDIPF